MNSMALKIYVFFCSNSLEQEPFLSVLSGFKDIALKTIAMPCSGKIDIPYLIKAFETGADGAVIVTCKRNECQHLEGNLRAEKRAQAVQSLLEEIGMCKDQIEVIMLDEKGMERVVEKIGKFNDRIKKIRAGRIEAKV